MIILVRRQDAGRLEPLASDDLCMVAGLIDRMGGGRVRGRPPERTP